MGIATAEDRVQVEFGLGIALKLYDVIEIDGELVEVVGLTHHAQETIVRHRAPLVEGAGSGTFLP
jgi:hypothetical protein